jgi:hypothetical protein
MPRIHWTVHNDSLSIWTWTYKCREDVLLEHDLQGSTMSAGWVPLLTRLKMCFKSFFTWLTYTSILAHASRCFTADFCGSGLSLTLHGRPHGSSIIINNKDERRRCYALETFWIANFEWPGALNSVDSLKLYWRPENLHIFQGLVRAL